MSSADSHLHFNRLTKTRPSGSSSNITNHEDMWSHLQQRDTFKARIHYCVHHCALCSQETGSHTLYVSIVAGGVTQPGSPGGPARLTKDQRGPSENRDSPLCGGFEGLSGAADCEEELHESQLPGDLLILENRCDFTTLIAIQWQDRILAWAGNFPTSYQRSSFLYKQSS